MGFLGHVLPGTFFILFGSWWYLNIIQLLIQRNKERHPHFFNKTWFPSSLLLKCKSNRPIEPCIKIIFALIGSVGELSYGDWTLYSHGDFVGPNIANFSHATMFAFFGLTGIVEILTQSRIFRDALPQSFAHTTSCMAFLAEGFLFLFHLDHGRSELNRKAHVILYVVIFSCAGAMVVEGYLKPSPGATMVRTYLVTLQGTWLIQVVFMLYGPRRWNERNRASDMFIPVVFAFHMLSLFLLFLMVYLVTQYIKVYKHKDTIDMAQNESNFREESLPLYKDTEESQEGTSRLLEMGIYP